MTITSAAAPRRSPGRLFVVLGLGLETLGALGYVVQIATGSWTAPWYMPSLATLGVVFLAIALWQARSVWRILALLLVVLLAGAEWTFLLTTRLPAYTGPVAASVPRLTVVPVYHPSRLPAYTGPVAAGRPFPNFVTKRADGTRLTQADLEGDQNTLLVFFRGRW
jgi:hypothetical protein